MKSSPGLLRQIRYLVHDEWVCDTDSPEDDRRTWEQFHAALDPMPPEGLHQFAANFNCDCGIEALRRVIRHPRCDLGTALMVFWRLGPGYFFQYDLPESVPAEERDEYALLAEIQAKVVAGEFPAGEIAVDPRRLDGEDLTRRYKAQGGSARVAPEMFASSPGRVVKLLSL